MATQVPLDEALSIVRHNLCSDCYGQLISHAVRGTRLFEITCTTEGCPCHGFVTRGYVDRAEAENRADLAEARHALRAAVPWAKKSEDQLMKELGF